MPKNCLLTCIYIYISGMRTGRDETRRDDERRLILRDETGRNKLGRFNFNVLGRDEVWDGRVSSVSKTAKKAVNRPSFKSSRHLFHALHYQMFFFFFFFFFFFTHSKSFYIFSANLTFTRVLQFANILAYLYRVFQPVHRGRSRSAPQQKINK